MLPDVTVEILDGGLGMLPPSSSGLHAKVGVASRGTVDEIIAISDQADVAKKFGTGPLANALFDSFAAGARIIYAVRAEGDVPGSIGEVTAIKTGTGDIAVTGTPLDAYELVVEVVGSGGGNTASFKYSLDAGNNFSAIISMPTTLTYDLPGTGLTLTFTEDLQPESSFEEGDVYTCSISAPQASIASVNRAIDVLLDSAYLYEYIHIVGESDDAMWAALSAKAAAAEARYRFMHFLAEARGPNADETVDAWVAALLEQKKSFASSRVSICAGRFEINNMGSGRLVDRNGAGLYAGRVSSSPVQRSPGKVMDGPLPAVVALSPAGINDGHILALDEAGFVTFRQYIGLSGFYITNGRMAAETISDYRYVELRRPMDRACTLVRTASLRSEHAEIDPTNMEKSLAALEAQLTAPLDIMVGAQEIARGRVIIPRDQDVLATSTIRVKVRIVPMGTIRWIELEIGYENPFQAAA